MREKIDEEVAAIMRQVHAEREAEARGETYTQTADDPLGALDAFAGRVVLYAGEPRGGANGTDAFFDALDARYYVAATVALDPFPAAITPRDVRAEPLCLHRSSDASKPMQHIAKTNMTRTGHDDPSQTRVRYSPIASWLCVMETISPAGDTCETTWEIDRSSRRGRMVRCRGRPRRDRACETTGSRAIWILPAKASSRARMNCAGRAHGGSCRPRGQRGTGGGPALYPGM